MIDARILSPSMPLGLSIVGKEWHHDFLEPWVHYVSITLVMKESPETLMFRAETPEGQAIAKLFSGIVPYFTRLLPSDGNMMHILSKYTRLQKTKCFPAAISALERCPSSPYRYMLSAIPSCV